MQFSKLITYVAFVVAACALLAEATRNYNDNDNHFNNNNNHNNLNNGHYGAGNQDAALSHYGGGSHNSGGYNKHADAHHARRPHYHSYAVRPAIYGGHMMYNYRGYARHYPAPARAHYKRQHGRVARRPHHNHQHHQANRYNNNNNHHHHQHAYNSGPKYGNRQQHHGNQANRYNQHHHQQARPELLPAGYTLKPINALALVPISHGSQYYNHMVGNNHNGHAGYANNNNHNHHHHHSHAHAGAY